MKIIYQMINPVYKYLTYYILPLLIYYPTTFFCNNKYYERITIITHVIWIHYLVQLCHQFDCLIADCDVDPAIAAALLTVHNNIHVGVPAPTTKTKQKAPKLTKSTISGGSSDETWNVFHIHWSLFKNGTQLKLNETT